MLVENLLLTAQFILSVVFSFLRQAIKMGRFLHNYQFFLTLVEQISRIGNTVQPTLPCWVVPTAGSLSITSNMFVQDLIRTILFAIVGAVVSFFVSLVLKNFIRNKNN